MFHVEHQHYRTNQDDQYLLIPYDQLMQLLSGCPIVQPMEGSDGTSPLLPARREAQDGVGEDRR